MNAIQIATIVAMIVGVVWCDKITLEEQLKAAMTVLKPCLEKTGATDADIKTIINKDPLITRTSQCMTHCVMEQFQMISDRQNGTGYGLDCESFLNLAKMQGANAPEMALLEQFCRSCETIQDDDKCSFAKKLSDCMTAEAIKNGIDPKEMI